MPEVLERCVEKLKADGHTEPSAYAICSESTGWKAAKGGGWRKEKPKTSKNKGGLLHYTKKKGLL